MKGSLVNPVTIQSAFLRSVVNITRPANTTAYADLDVFGGATTANLEFTGINNYPGQAVMLLDAKFRIDLTAIPSGMTNFSLYLYHTAPTAIADNAVYNWIEADKAKLITIIEFTPAKIGDTGILWDEVCGINKVLNVASGTSSIYGVMQTAKAYTPTSAGTSSIELFVKPI